MAIIYQIRCVNNDKVYIGSSTRGINRQHEHWSDLRRNTHPNKYLQNSWSKHGEEAFKFEILLKTTNDKIIQHEDDELNCYRINGVIDKSRCYNIGITAVHPMLGAHRSEETKIKISKSNLGKKRSAETREKITLSNFKKDKLLGRRKLNSNNTSGFKGISWHKQMKKWYCRIWLDGRRHDLGLFKSKEEAIHIYNEAMLEFGQK